MGKKRTQRPCDPLYPEHEDGLPDPAENPDVIIHKQALQMGLRIPTLRLGAAQTDKVFFALLLLFTKRFDYGMVDQHFRGLLARSLYLSNQYRSRAITILFQWLNDWNRAQAFTAMTTYVLSRGRGWTMNEDVNWMEGDDPFINKTVVDYNPHKVKQHRADDRPAVWFSKARAQHATLESRFSLYLSSIETALSIGTPTDMLPVPMVSHTLLWFREQFLVEHKQQLCDALNPYKLYTLVVVTHASMRMHWPNKASGARGFIHKMTTDLRVGVDEPTLERFVDDKVISLTLPATAYAVH